MFTVEQINAAHAKVKSGADFPAYIQEIKALGVTHYETYVVDGHIDYHGPHAHSAKVPAKYPPLAIADRPAAAQFKTALTAHQQGQTDFLTFIRDCAGFGIDRWKISMDKMTCTYFDKTGKEVLTENIPQ
jgi:uncharacterized protein YbcV (DUF1398 family)